jgi:hypothetical protein
MSTETRSAARESSRIGLRVTMQAGKVVAPIGSARQALDTEQPGNNSREHRQSHDAGKLFGEVTPTPVLGTSLDACASTSTPGVELSPKYSHARLNAAAVAREAAPAALLPAAMRISPVAAVSRAAPDGAKADCPARHGLRPFSAPANGNVTCALCVDARIDATLEPDAPFFGCKECRFTACVDCFNSPPAGATFSAPSYPSAGGGMFGSADFGAAMGSFWGADRGKPLLSPAVDVWRTKDKEAAKRRPGFRPTLFTMGRFIPEV